MFWWENLLVQICNFPFVIKNHLMMLQQVVQLRKACSHPYLFDGVEPEHLIQVIFLCGFETGRSNMMVFLREEKVMKEFFGA